MSSHLARLEALLFVAGEDGLSLRTMAQLLEMPVTGLTQSLDKLQAKYEADEDSSLCLLESSNTYKLVTKANFASLLREYSKTPINQSLSRASLEVLSIIAYKQPITRAEVDAIRGVNSSGAITKLQAFDLVREAGKKDAVGRPNLYATTDYFLDYMGINSLDELVAIDQLELEDQETSLFKEEDLEEHVDFDNQA
ncbi:SMC-Scp complex subunit ScpB [uncultured Streptococcus sp.]|uniref:SMC-Scp complex subunit ScpB n=1 Tax=uncultured Streptococcus sp. TaxID=83427 RepID=UPI0025E71971|nr:SMC-Scp complex subunit ScpB [uncultured Streptococcus sp.]